MSEHADYDAVGISDKETADAPRLIDWAVDHIVAASHGLGVRPVNSLPRSHVYTHGWQGWLHAPGCEHDLRLAGTEPEVAAAEGALLQSQHAGIERARRVVVGGLVIGNDAANGDRASLAQARLWDREPAFRGTLALQPDTDVRFFEYGRFRQYRSPTPPTARGGGETSATIERCRAERSVAVRARSDAYRVMPQEPAAQRIQLGAVETEPQRRHRCRAAEARRYHLRQPEVTPYG